jgi:hypothetical protein
MLALGFWALQAGFVHSPTRARRMPLLAAFAIMVVAVGLQTLALPRIETGAKEWFQLRTWFMGRLALRNAVALSTEYTPVMAVGMGFVGAWVGVLGTSRRRLALFSVLAVLGFGFIYSSMMTYPRQLTDGRYQVGAYLFLAILAAIAVERLFEATREFPWRRTLLTLLGVLSLLSAISYEGMMLPHDLDAELAFIRETLPQLPQNAVIHFADPNESAPCPGHRIEEPLELGLEPPRYLGRAIGRPDLKWAPWPPKPEDAGRPLFYYAMANCLAIPHAKYYDQVANEIEGPWPDADLMERFRIHQCHCRTALEVVGHRPVVERSLPSRAWSRIRYRRALVPVGFYEILPEDLARIEELRREAPCRRRPCPSP